jgi:uncharacterized protein (DUF58 family)
MTSPHLAPGLELLPAETLSRLGKLELLARGVVEGFVTGKHQSPYMGFSAEFAEHRQYVPGDDIRSLDWRALGRSDRYYVKQYVDETNLRATIVVDASGSMGYAGEQAEVVAGRRMSKFHYAQHLAAALAYVLIHQQDAVGLVRFDTQIRRYIPARSRPTHLSVLLDDLHASRPGGETSLAAALHDVAERIPRRGLVLLLSDLFDDPEAMVSALHHLRFRKHEVIVFHLMADEELTFPFQKWARFTSLESARHEVLLDPRAVQAEYLARLGQYLRRLDSACGQMQIDYVPMNTKQPYAVSLSNFLGGRMARRR